MNKKDAMDYFQIKKLNQFFRSKGSLIRARVEKNGAGDYDRMFNYSDLTGNLPDCLELAKQGRAWVEEFEKISFEERQKEWESEQ